MAITRFNTALPTIAVDTTAAACDPIPFADYAGGQVYVPTGSSITSLAWYSSPDNATYTPVYDGLGNACSSTIAASENCPIPAACFACMFLKAVGNAAGIIAISLKS